MAKGNATSTQTEIPDPTDVADAPDGGKDERNAKRKTRRKDNEPPPTLIENAETNASLRELRATLDGDQMKFVRHCVNFIEADLIRCIPQLVKSVEDTERQASYTPPLAIKPARKGGYLTAEIKPRMRAPRDGLKLVVHIDDGQLRLGLPQPVDPDDDFMEEDA